MTLAEVFAAEPPTDDAEAEAAAFAAWLAPSEKLSDDAVTVGARLGRGTVPE